MRLSSNIGWFGIGASFCASAKGGWEARELAREPGMLSNPWFWVLLVALTGMAAIPGAVGSWTIRNPTPERAGISLWVSGLFLANFTSSLVPIDRWNIGGRFISMAIAWGLSISIILMLNRKIRNETR
jgi:hypothetical protein